MSEVEVVLQRVRIERLAAAATDDDVLLDSAHDLEDGVQVQLGGDLGLHRFEEQLLPGIAVEVRVEVAEPHIRQSVRGVHALISRQEADLRHSWTGIGIAEITVIDVEPDAAELVHEIRETAEIDRDEIVDRETGERAHGFDRSERPTLRERSVDPISQVRVAGTFDRRDQVAREREHGEGVRPWICANENQRVRASGELRFLAFPPVGADHEGHRRLTGNRQVEALGCGAISLRLRGDRLEELMRLEIRRTRRPTRDHDRGQHHPEDHGPHHLPRGTARRVRLAIAPHRRVDARRVHRAAVAVDGRAAPHASLEGGFHTA
jgi:hypothetical protein